MSNQHTDLFTSATYIKKDEQDNFYLSGLKCNKCGEIFLDHRSTCSSCFANNQFNEIKLSNTGRLYSYSIVHRSFPGVDVPYISVIVDMDEGGTVKGNLINIEPNPENLTFDMEVKLVFKDALGRKDKDGNSYISYFFEPK
tara:strand:- start:80 stop:502 length:423 start_codon:yes stop_codon:yes gene_type:complete